jgi:serine/threonine protein kinase
MHTHELRIVHRDLKPGNVILDENLHPKVTDLGAAARIEREQAKYTIWGTMDYWAPEQFAQEAPFTEKIDIYAFGLIVWEMMTAMVPVVLADKSGLEPLDFSAVPENLRPLVQQCLAEDPRDRPTASEIVLQLRDGSLALKGTDMGEFGGYVESVLDAR